MHVHTYIQQFLLPHWSMANECVKQNNNKKKHRNNNATPTAAKKCHLEVNEIAYVNARALWHKLLYANVR